MSRLAVVAVSTVLALFAAKAVSAQTVEQNDSSAAEASKNNSLPLIPTRTLEFTTDEGTWISLDVSPDGETIVFELLGDLYTLPISGGTATRITSGPLSRRKSALACRMARLSLVRSKLS